MTDQSRRAFLQKSLLLSGFAFINSFPSLSLLDPWKQRNSESKRVIIIGAGLAGLSAAIELIKLGHDVTILEGNMRAGGRVKTERNSFADGLYADVGAARIPDNHEWTMKYIKDFGLELMPFLPTEGKFLQVFNGEKLEHKFGEQPPLSSYPLKLSQKEINMGWQGITSQPFTKLMGDSGDITDLKWPKGDLSKLDVYSFKEYLIKEGYSADLAQILMLGWESKHDMDISILEVLRELRLSVSSTKNKIVGGNDLLPRAMAKSIAGHIQYGSRVTDIQQSETNAEVYFTRAGHNEKMTADRVICTLPLGILKKMDFVNRLSNEKQNAIQETQFLGLSRTVVQTTEKPWVKAGFNGFSASNSPMETWDPMYENKQNRGLIAAYHKIQDSALIAKMNEEERMTFTLDKLEKLYPGTAAAAEGSFTQCWNTNPWSNGAGCIAGRNQTTKHLANLCSAEGRIHFGGEHASIYHTWMQGAIESGNRTAKEVHLG